MQTYLIIKKFHLTIIYEKNINHNLLKLRHFVPYVAP